MGYMKQFDKWLQFKELDTDLRKELQVMQGDESTLKDAFSKNLEFGTGGMRGELGAGTNRMNIYTIRKASQGIADYIAKHGQAAKERGVVIAFDSRRKSKTFSKEVAATLASNGIKAYVYDEPRTTPQLSFSIRDLHCFMGVMITASHNPPEYNGFKVYGEDGSQLNIEDANLVIEYINVIDNEFSIAVQDFHTLQQNKLIDILSSAIDQRYIAQIMAMPMYPELFKTTDLKTIFTPLHGASGSTVRSMFEKMGYSLSYVAKQIEPDGEFPTVNSPNPEEPAAFALAIQQGRDESSDLLVALDPDGDRVGIAVRKGDDYQLLTGNQTGAILIEYLLSNFASNNHLPENGRIFKTIVTSEFGRVIAAKYGVSTEDVLTGFKFIGEKINEYNKSGAYTFLFGYEESYGYLIKDFSRDKDAVQTALILVEAAAFYKQKRLTLLDVLEGLYAEHGYFVEGLVSVTKKGVEGSNAIQSVLEQLRRQPVLEIAGTTVTQQEDYLSSERLVHATGEKEAIHLPQSNVLKYFLADGTWICIRPSGTEPKIKYYFGVKGPSAEASNTRLELFKKEFSAYVDTLF
ncbi:phospho-sugar mutase [Viridibacillus sp. YIM B01967]|uniref:Phosphoglucomutase n=1 Tax=Viridibacillus soli TaxID=2798301 RepID=A0ABS1H847_9BACL|nr:phospho-sugar mutase [Viridibacillus soli]MBK3495593.1 phospho-sugar mutase [Viridibacillus soli]